MTFSSGLMILPAREDTNSAPGVAVGKEPSVRTRARFTFWDTSATMSSLPACCSQMMSQASRSRGKCKNNVSAQQGAPLSVQGFFKRLHFCTEALHFLCNSCHLDLGAWEPANPRLQACNHFRLRASWYCTTAGWLAGNSLSKSGTASSGAAACLTFAQASRSQGSKFRGEMRLTSCRTAMK